MLDEEKTPKKLTTVEKDDIFCGVCTGLSKYFEIDLAVIRFAFIISIIPFESWAIFIYLGLCFAMPDEEFYND